MPCVCAHEADGLACFCSRAVPLGSLYAACVSCVFGIHVMLPPDASATEVANAHLFRRSSDFPESA